MTQNETAERLDFIGFTREQREILGGLGESLHDSISTGLDRLYVQIARTPELRALFGDDARMRTAKSLQQNHWRTIGDGRFDDEYYRQVRAIGVTHARIGLSPKWYVGAYAIILEEVIRGMCAGRQGPLGRARGANPADAVVAVMKAALIDMEMSVSMYIEAAEAERNAAAAEVATREEELRQLLGRIGESAGTVRVSAEEIAQASDTLARRTETNAASIEETAKTVRIVSERLTDTAQSAERTVQRMAETAKSVGDSQRLGEQASVAMDEVSHSAENIDTVIEGLDKIAFQTRVLAMNAAVEAGRAGEAGRGFAVVADLVSSLAMRAEEEAKRAREQLSMTQQGVMRAARAVREMTASLSGISGHVDDANALISAIASDNVAQANAVTEISSAVSLMDDAGRQTAAMLEQTNAAAQSLRQEARALADMSGGTPPAPPSAPRSAQRQPHSAAHYAHAA